MERKYRQRGYQDDDRDRERGPRPPRPEREPQAPRGSRPPDAPRTPNLMASHDVVRCRTCAHQVTLPIGTIARCPGCGEALHSCAQCANFDPSARFQCVQPQAPPVFSKQAPNECTYFTPSVRVERQTSSAAPRDARSAFDDLFK